MYKGELPTMFIVLSLSLKMPLCYEKIEDIILKKIQEKDCKTMFYYGRIVDKHRENRIVLDALNPVLLSGLPPFFKFKKFTNENLYNQAISKMKSSTRQTDTLKIYYDGSNSKESVYNPTVTLYVHLPNKNCDIMISCYSLQKNVSKDNRVLEVISREIIECKTPEFTVQCIKVKNSTNTNMYEVNVEVKDKSKIKTLLFNLFEDTYCKRKPDEKIEEETNF